MLQIQRGQTVQLQLVFWQDALKTLPVNLAGAILSIPTASRNEMKALVPIVTNSALGRVTLTIPEEITWQFATGPNNYFVVEAQFSLSNVISRRVQINVNE